MYKGEYAIKSPLDSETKDTRLLQTIVFIYTVIIWEKDEFLITRATLSN